jgi:hypothetical protein
MLSLPFPPSLSHQISGPGSRPTLTATQSRSREKEMREKRKEKTRRENREENIMFLSFQKSNPIPSCDQLEFKEHE